MAGTWQHNGRTYSTIERRIWRWQTDEFRHNGWIIHWWSLWSWLRPRARRHIIVGGISHERQDWRLTDWRDGHTYFLDETGVLKVHKR